MAPGSGGALLKRRIRSAGGSLIRRMGLLPAGTPDGIGEDAQLVGTRFDEQVIVYFAETPEGLYQIRPWYGPLRALHRVHPLVIITSDSRTAKAIRSESGLRVVTVTRYATLDDVFSRSDVRLILYPNHNSENFSMLRFSPMIHVALTHGDSDKIISVSNQVKAYDFTFASGQAAIDRMQRYLPRFDAQSRSVIVGRPRVDPIPARPRPVVGQRISVLYAPTWEGGQPTAGYSSLTSHGAKMVGHLLADGRFRVLYRPHPLSGVRLAEYGEADAQIRALVRTAGDDHCISLDEPLDAAMAASDVLVCDVSAVTVEWLPTGRPFVVTVPENPDAVVAATRMLDVVPRLERSALADVAALVAREALEDPSFEAREAMIRYYVGETAPGASLRAFLDACRGMIELAAPDAVDIA